jgi:ribosomal protein S18 acetylase RimI-like enzyme
MQSPVILRPATPADVDTVCDVYLSSRKRFLPFAPSAHSDDDARRWMRERVIPSGGAIVACMDDVIVGMMALSKTETHGWIDQLYLHPDFVSRGIGTQLLLHAKSILGSPIRLYTFQANAGARRFYERHGFAAIEFDDGSKNEENCPDVLYEWRLYEKSTNPFSSPRITRPFRN